jgi:hypothetical protein
VRCYKKGDKNERCIYSLYNKTRKYKENTMKVHKNGTLTHDGKKINTEYSTVYIAGDTYNTNILFYSTLISPNVSRLRIKRIEHKKPPCPANLFAYPKNNPIYAKMFSFIKPTIVKLNKIANYFSYKTQLEKAKEEMEELKTEIESCNIMGIIEESVDVIIVLLQILLYHGINRAIKVFNEKISRTLYRIDIGYYNNNDTTRV